MNDGEKRLSIKSVRRVRQHVNPLSSKYQRSLEIPDWSAVFSHPHHPLHIDIGCARGEFLLQMAEEKPTWNFLGLEIRIPIVEQAQHYQTQAGLTNLYFMFCNVNPSLSTLLESLPSAVLQCVSIQFPDPWFKKRHQKRRVVQPELVSLLAQHLPLHGQLFIQSDVESVAVDMRDRIQTHPAFQLLGDPKVWLPESPFPAQTERERVTLEKREPVYRALFERCERCAEP